MSKDVVVKAIMALMRGDEADAAVPMLLVVPTHNAEHPFPSRLQGGVAVDREMRPVYMHVRNTASEKALSLLTPGLSGDLGTALGLRPPAVTGVLPFSS